MLVRLNTRYAREAACPLDRGFGPGQRSMGQLPALLTQPGGFLSGLDWKVLAGIGAVVLVVLLVAGGKRARRKRRAELIKARLEYAEKAARIKRKTL